jgi:hypothetical protein
MSLTPTPPQPGTPAGPIQAAPPVVPPTLHATSADDYLPTPVRGPRRCAVSCLCWVRWPLVPWWCGRCGKP